MPKFRTVLRSYRMGFRLC